MAEKDFSVCLKRLFFLQRGQENSQIFATKTEGLYKLVKQQGTKKVLVLWDKPLPDNFA